MKTNPANGGVAPRPLPPITNAADFMAELLVPPPDLVPGVFHKAGKFALGGGSKTYKSWTFAALALALNTGTDWLGWTCRKSRVLYVNFEIHPAFFQERLRKIAQAKGLTVDGDGLLLWNLRGHPGSFDIVVPRIVEEAKDRGLDASILDPLYKLYKETTEENSAKDIAALFNGIDVLMSCTDAGVAFGAHYSKGNQAAKDTIDRVSGSGVFGRDPDSILNFTRHKEQDCFTVEGVLRHHPPIEPFVVRWEFPLFRPAPDLDPGDLRVAQGSGPATTDGDVARLCGADGVQRSWLVEELTKRFGIKERTAQRAVKDAIDDGAVEWDKRTGLVRRRSVLEMFSGTDEE